MDENSQGVSIPVVSRATKIVNKRVRGAPNRAFLLLKNVFDKAVNPRALRKITFGNATDLPRRFCPLASA